MRRHDFYKKLSRFSYEELIDIDGEITNRINGIATGKMLSRPAERCVKVVLKSEADHSKKALLPVLRAKIVKVNSDTFGRYSLIKSHKTDSLKNKLKEKAKRVFFCLVLVSWLLFCDYCS